MSNEITEYKSNNPCDILLNAPAMVQIMKLAEIMSKGVATVPKHLQGQTSDCLAIIMQAHQWGMSPFIVAQKTYLINGIMGYESQLVNAVITSSGAINGRFNYEYKEDKGSLECRVGAVLNGDETITWGEWLAINTVTTKNSPLWKTNPKQQLAYLQVKNWARLYCPSAIMGVYTNDELQQVSPEEFDVVPLPIYTLDQAKEKLATWVNAKTSHTNILTRIKKEYDVPEDVEKFIIDNLTAAAKPVDPYSEIKDEIAACEDIEQLELYFSTVPVLKQKKVAAEYNTRFEELKNGQE